MTTETPNDQHPTTDTAARAEIVWNSRIAAIRTMRDMAKDASDQIKAMRAAFEEELRPLKDQLYAYQASERTLLDDLTAEMVTQADAGGPKTFGGVQLRSNMSVEITDKDAALAAFEETYWGEKPLVKVVKSLDERGVAQWLKQQPRKAAQQGMHGVRLVEGFTVALLSDSNDTAS